VTDIRFILSENVRFYRKKAGKTQKAFAQSCGVSQPYIGEIESSRKYASLQLIETFARVLEVEPWRLFLLPHLREMNSNSMMTFELRESMGKVLEEALLRSRLES